MADNLVTTPATPTTPVTETPVTPPVTPPTTPPVETPAKPPVETPVPPVETPVTPVAPVTPPPQVDTAEIEKNVSEKVSKSVIEKIGEALGLTKKEEEKIPTDPVELAKFVEDKSKKTVQDILSEKDKVIEDEKVERQKQLAEGSKRYQALWSGQFEYLAGLGKVPKIVDATDKNDPGQMVKTKLLTKLYEVLQENEKNGVDEVPTLKEIFYEFPEVLTNKVAGATTPVSGGGRSPTSGQEMNYQDLHKSSFEEILKKD